jgi:hypothetical protein
MVELGLELQGVRFGALAYSKQVHVRQIAHQAVRNELARLGGNACITPWRDVYDALWKDWLRSTGVQPSYLRNFIINHYRNYLANADDGKPGNHPFKISGSASSQHTEAGSEPADANAARERKSEKLTAEIHDDTAQDFTPYAALLADELRMPRTIEFDIHARDAHVPMLHTMINGSAPYGSDRSELHAEFIGTMDWPLDRADAANRIASERPSALELYSVRRASQKRIGVRLRTLDWHLDGESGRWDFSTLFQRAYLLPRKLAWRVSCGLVRAAYLGDHAAVQRLVELCTERAARGCVSGGDSVDGKLSLHVQEIWTRLCNRRV